MSRWAQCVCADWSELLVQVGAGRLASGRLNVKWVCVSLQVIRKDLEDCEAQIIALETLVSSNPANSLQFERLYADWKLLYKAVQVRFVLLKMLQICYL